MRFKEKPIKQEKGITLIALIITIIVLVILAAVTLNSIFGSNIIGLATNGAINYAEEQQKELGMLNDVSDLLGDITGDTDRPMSPSITLSGTEGENGYYISDVGVTISAGDAADVASIKYKVERANPIAETEVQGTTANFDITADGTSTITAYIINSAGLTSETITQEVNKDTTMPSIATIVAGTAERTTIEVTATGADVISGVGSYIFQYSTTSSEEGFTTALEVPNTTNSCTFEYQDLATDTTYYLRVIVKDRAGNTTTSTAVTTKTKTAELTETELASNIGAYIDYTPVSGTFSDHVGSTYSGDEDGINTPLSTVTSLKWRILFAEDNTLTLISDTTANTGFTLNDADGYNNGVLLLNNACKAMYSNSTLGATGRSLNIDDIEAVSSYDKTTFPGYGREFTTDSRFRYYPNIFAQEKTGSVNGTYGTKYDLSDQDSYVTGYTQASTLKGKQASYLYRMSTSYMTSSYLELFRYQPGTTTDLSEGYWLASRRVDFYGYNAIFGMFHVSWGTVDANHLYGSDSSNDSSSYAVRPVVEINLSSVNIGLTGDGGRDTPYSITVK